LLNGIFHSGYQLKYLMTTAQLSCALMPVFYYAILSIFRILPLPWVHIFFSDIALKTSNRWSFFEEGNKYCSKILFHFNSQIVKRNMGR